MDQRAHTSVLALACLASCAVVANACGGGADAGNASGTGSGGSHPSSGTPSSSTSTGPNTGPSSAASGSTSSGSNSSTSSGTGGSTGATTLALPQLVHGAAYVDTALYPTIPVVVAATGATPDSVEVSVDGTATMATLGANGWVANVAMTLAPGPHALTAKATIGSTTAGTVSGSLVASGTSLQFTKFATDGISSNGHLMHDVAGDALVYTWVSDPTGNHHDLWMNRLDGAFARLLPMDVAINDPADEPLSGYTALSTNGIGAVYRTPKPGDSHWLVKMRVVDAMGAEVVPVIDLTQGEAAFSMGAAAADPGGFSGAWLHISPSVDGGTPPVEVRFARYDLTTKKLVGPITVDMDQPAAPADTAHTPQALEPLAELSMACNSTVCVLTYVRDVYNSTATTVEPKVFLATIDLTTGTLANSPVLVGGTQNYDFQMWGNDVIALADGSFVLVYQESLLLPPACTTPMYGPTDDCCQAGSEESDSFRVARIDKAGNLSSATSQLYAFEGAREFPRIAEHPEGFALFWEDQRTECNAAGGFIRMAPNVASPALTSLLDPYVELPGSIALPGEDPSLAVTGTSFVMSWSDNRNGNGLLDDEDEQYFDTYWRK